MIMRMLLPRLLPWIIGALIYYRSRWFSGQSRI
jgi:hypothetical protein